MNIIYSFLGYPATTPTAIDAKEIKEIQTDNGEKINDSNEASLEARDSDTDWDLLFIENENSTTEASCEKKEEDSPTENSALPPASHEKLAIETPNTQPSIALKESLTDKQTELLNALENDPNNYNAYCDLAATLSGKSCIQIHGEALNQKRIYLKATQVNPNNPKAFFQLVLLILQEEPIRLEIVKKTLVKVVSINPHHIKAFELLGKHFDSVQLKNGTTMTKGEIFNHVTELKRAKSLNSIKV